MLTIRLAREDDLDAIASLMTLAIERLQKAFLDDEQIEASKAAMGLDRQLIADRTYYCVFDDGAFAGCGGWSRRATHYGGDHSVGRDPRLLDPARERARIRAMYTHPDHVRRGVGRLILKTAEDAARAEGFRAVELSATRAGVPLYRACGYRIEREFFDTAGGVAVPLAVMAKAL